MTWFFNGWDGVLRTLVVGAAAYVALVVMLRVSGKRTLSKMNAFDLVVTVALGSALATILVSRTTPLADGVTALGLLIVLQYLITRASVHAGWFRRAVRSEPQLLVLRGQILEAAARRERVSRDELYQAVRAAGQASLSQVYAVVLEADGSLNVIANASQGEDAVPSDER